MRGRVLKPFQYSTNGLTAHHLDVGDERDFRDDLAPGLLAEGFIAEVKLEPAPAQQEPSVRRGRMGRR